MSRLYKQSNEIILADDLAKRPGTQNPAARDVGSSIVVKTAPRKRAGQANADVILNDDRRRHRGRILVSMGPLSGLPNDQCHQNPQAALAAPRRELWPALSPAKLETA